MAQAHPGHFVNVQFARGSSIEHGKPRHPWHWCILIQQGHVYHISTGWTTLGEAEADFRENGVAMVEKAEQSLKECYSHSPGEPYDVNIVNP